MEELLQELFGLMPEGTFVDIEEFKTFIEEDGTDELFDLFKPGTFEDEEQFNQYIEPLKKKDSPQVSPTQDMGLDTTMQEQTIPEDQSSSGLSSPLAGSLSDGLNVQNLTEESVFIPEKPVGTRYGANTQAGEKNTWLEEMVGKNTITDFFGDMWRAGKQGVGQGATLDDALNLYARGASISKDDLTEYMRVVEEMDNIGMSDEMRSFNKIYEESGGGVLGFVKGVAFNPSVINQLFISSIASMVNPTVAAGAGTGAVVGGGVGAAAGAVGGPLAAITGAGGAITGSLMGAGAALETGLSFTEFLKEAVEKKGLEFNDDGIRAVLEDPEALQRIRNKSAARGLVIGTIDGLTRGVAGKLGGAGVKAAKAAGKQVSTKLATRAALKAAGIEALGGSAGETAARLVTGQELDVAEIGFEGITGQASSILSVPTAVTGTSLTDVARNVFKPAKYGTISKGGDVTPTSKADIEAMVDTMTDEEIRTAQFEIKNDPELSNKITLRKQAAQFDLDIPDYIQGEDRANLIALEQESANMQDPKMKVNKKRKADIDAQIDQILEKYEGVIAESVEVSDGKGSTTTNTVSITRDFAIEALENEGVTDASVEQIEAKQKELLEQAKKDAAADLKATQEKSSQEGVENPTQEPVKENTDAIQEPSTTQVDAQESTQDSQTVGEGDTTTNVSTESTEVESSSTPQAQTETEVNDAIESKDPVKLKDVRTKLIEEKQEGSESFNNVMNTIKEVAAEENVSVDEFLQAEQQVTADPQRVKNIAQDIKKKILGRRPKSINPAFIVKQVTEYLGGTKLAEQLNQVEYDALVREVSEDLGIQAPSRASITKGFKLAEQNNRMLGTINEGQNKTVPQKRVVVNERTALKDQIIMQAKAAKKAVKSYQSFLKNIVSEIKSLKKGGKLSPTQTTTLTDRLANVKPFVKESVDSYLAFVDKVMTDADFVAKITRAKKLKTKAKKNIKSKIGPVSNDLKVALNEVLGFNPSIIPDAQLDSYLQLLEEFGSTSAVLDLKQKSETMQQALDIINAVEAEVNVDENLSIDKEPTPRTTMSKKEWQVLRKLNI